MGRETLEIENGGEIMTYKLIHYGEQEGAAADAYEWPRQ